MTLLFAFILAGSVAAAYLSYRWLWDNDLSTQHCVGCGAPAVAWYRRQPVCQKFIAELEGCVL